MATIADVRALMVGFGAELGAAIDKLSADVDQAVVALASLDQVAIQTLMDDITAEKVDLEARFTAALTKLEAALAPPVTPPAP